MPLVSESQLSALRAMREDNMPFLCDAEEETLVDDPAGTGGKVATWVAVSGLTEIPCSAVAMSGNESVSAQQVAPAANTFVYLPWRYGTLLKAKYRLVVRGEIAGEPFVETYGILFVATPKSVSVQTTVYARSGQASAGEPRMSAARTEAAAEPALGNTRPQGPLFTDRGFFTGGNPVA